MSGEKNHGNPPPSGSLPGGGDQTSAHSDSWDALSRADLSGATTAIPEPEATEEPEPPTVPVPVRRSRIWPRVLGVLILLLGVGGAWVWLHPALLQNAMALLSPAASNQKQVADAIKALDTRVSQLEHQPGTADLAARIETLEKRQSSPAPEQPQVAQQQQPVDLRPLVARLDALEARVKEPTPAPPPPPPAVVSTGSGVSQSFIQSALDRLAAEHRADAVRVDAIAAKVEALSSQAPAADLHDKLDEVSKQLNELTASETKLAAETGQAMRLGRVDAAQIALASGQPVGAVPNAPPALARFATRPPPTEPALRLEFSAASQEALKVSRPDTEDKPFFDRVLARLQDFRLVTVREGDHVVIGNSAAAILLHAQALLAAGDLGGAVKAVGTLTGPPAEKMAAWLDQAKSLLEARQALASLVENG